MNLEPVAPQSASTTLAEPLSDPDRPLQPGLRETGLSVLIPCFNEEGAIRQTIEQLASTIRELDCRYELMVIDDGSRDNTADIAEQAGARVIRKPINQGYGAALKTGLRHARYGWIAITDADGTYPIGEIPRLASFAADHDMIVGARTGQTVKIPLVRRPAKWCINQLANYLSGYRIPDLNSGLRLFRRELAERFVSLFPDGFSFTTTITVAALTNGYRVKFVPIDYYQRVGKSSIQPIRDTLGFTFLVVRLATYFKPLNVFFPPALFLCVAGFAKAIFDLIRTNAFGVGSSLVMLSGIQLAFLGLLADLILRRTKL